MQVATDHNKGRQRHENADNTNSQQSSDMAWRLRYLNGTLQYQIRHTGRYSWVYCIWATIASSYMHPFDLM